MRILLTGATGFLGSHLLAHLIEGGHEVVVILRPSSNSWRIDHLLDCIKVCRIGAITIPQLFELHRIDAIIHCATNYGRKEVDPSALLDANLIFPLQLLHHGNAAGVRCFINTDTVLDKRINHYSLSKKQFKEWLHQYSSTMACINVALEHFYGPHDDPTKFVTFIIRSLLERIDHIDLTLGEQKRDFIHINDVVSAFLLILQHSSSLRSGYFDYELGTGKTISIREFVELVKELAGNDSTHLNFGAVPYRENEVMETLVDTRTIRALGWETSYSLYNGLKITINEERSST